MTTIQPSLQAAELGEPSYIWRSGQQRRLEMIQEAAGNRIQGKILEIGCGIGLYITHIAPMGGMVFGSEYEINRAVEARTRADHILGSAGEFLPFPEGSFDLILSNEVIEHVQDDLLTVREMVRVLKPGGRIVLFCPNRWYPFETHGIYWKDKYYFGNKFLVNYLPTAWRNKLAPHVRVYTRKDLDQLFNGLPIRYIQQRVIYGGYDGLTSRFPKLGKLIKTILYRFEKTPLQILGLSHFWVIEKEV
jgi:SAM-dependent methyltransferase